MIPFICGFLLGQFLPQGLLPHPEARLVAALFLGTALSIPSVKIVAVVVREMVAVALARVGSEPLRMVYVSTTRDKGARRDGAGISFANEEGILNDAAAAAARYDVDVITTLRTNIAPEEAILQEIRTSGADLVVLGVDRMAGDSLNFGSVAAAVLSKSKVSVLLIADGETDRRV